jgi:hypothetical protein
MFFGLEKKQTDKIEFGQEEPIEIIRKRRHGKRKSEIKIFI